MLGEGNIPEAVRLNTLYRELLAALADPAVRDLAWLLASPGLLRTDSAAVRQVAWGGDQLPAIRQWLLDLDRQPAALHTELRRLPQKRLGHYAEQLLAYFLEHGPAGRLIAANLPVRRGNQTLGECDFLLSAADGTRVHWELAVKCYLYTGAGAPPPHPPAGTAPYTELARYVGPDLTDRFDRKLGHMLDHQLPLSGRPEFAARVDGGPWRAELFLKGWLFYPLAQAEVASPEIAPQRWLEPQHLRGWWATREAWLEQRSTLNAQGWLVLSRRSWMAPQQADPAALVLDDAALEACLARQFPLTDETLEAADSPAPASASTNPRASPILIAAMRKSGHGWQEGSRGFIVERAWQTRAQAFAANGTALEPD
jgi:uncharacterized protein